MMEYVILDIETGFDRVKVNKSIEEGLIKGVPSKKEIKEKLLKKIESYKTQKTKDDRLKTLEKDVNAEYFKKSHSIIEKQRFNPLFNKVKVVSLSQNGEIYQKTIGDNSESDLIKFAFESAIYGKDNLLVTFNGTEFDLPVLLSRAEMLRVNVDYPEISRRLSHAGRHHDMYRMYKWTQGSSNLSLQLFARGLGSKKEIYFDKCTIQELSEYALDEMKKFDAWVRLRFGLKYKVN